MSEEKTKEAPKEEPKVEITSDKKEETKPEELSETDKQYEEELSKLRQERDNYKIAFQEERSKRKTEENVDGEPAEPQTKPAFDPEDIRKKVGEEMDRKLSAFKLEQAKNLMTEELKKISQNPKEQELIMEHYKRTIRPSGIDQESIRRDLLLCKAAANLKRVSLIESDETGVESATALYSQGAGKVSEAEAVASHNLTAEEKSFLKKYGVSEKDLTS